MGSGFTLQKVNPDRMVNNIYFDTPDLETYFDNISEYQRERNIDFVGMD